MKNWRDIHMSYLFQAYFKYISNIYHITLPETLVTVRTWKKQVGRRSFPFGIAYFGRWYVSLVWKCHSYLVYMSVKQIYVKHSNSHISVPSFPRPFSPASGLSLCRQKKTHHRVPSARISKASDFDALAPLGRENWEDCQKKAIVRNHRDIKYVYVYDFVCTNAGTYGW